MQQRVTKVKEKTLSGFSETLPIGAKAEDITLNDGTILQDVISVLQTGQAGHEVLSLQQYNALSNIEKNNGTVYFVPDGGAGGSNYASSVIYENASSGSSATNVQDVIDELYDANMNVVDSLASTSTTAALSAAQGKVLNDKIILNTPLWVDFGTISSLPITKASDRIKSSMICTMSEVGTPSALTSDLTITTIDGQVTVSGTPFNTGESTTLKILLQNVDTIT